jgi:hypothetical protein
MHLKLSLSDRLEHEELDVIARVVTQESVDYDQHSVCEPW